MMKHKKVHVDLFKFYLINKTFNYCKYFNSLKNKLKCHGIVILCSRYPVRAHWFHFINMVFKFRLTSFLSGEISLLSGKKTNIYSFWNDINTKKKIDYLQAIIQTVCAITMCNWDRKIVDWRKYFVQFYDYPTTCSDLTIQQTDFGFDELAPV